ncbi:MAG: hypothetical protein AAF942_18585, partial [Pseudomonadota bacterium]
MSEDKHNARGDSGNIIFLSLFLLLLAFFILLNALATIEETKSRKVLSSVAATFRSLVDADTTAQILISDLGPAPEVYEVMDALEQLWVTAVPITRVDRLTRGQVMQMTLPVNELFLGGEPTLRADREALFDRTSLLLRLKTAASHVEMQMVFGVRDDADARSTAGGRLALARAGTIANLLSEQGAPD